MKLECLGANSKGNCYALTLANGDIILLDCGVRYEIIKKHLKMRVFNIKAVLITHEHQDHCKGLKSLLESGVNAKVFMTYGTANALDAKGIHIIASKQPFKVGNVTMTAYDSKHNAAEPVVFTVYDSSTKESLVYLTDCAKLEQRFDGFNYYLYECNYLESKIMGKEVRGHVKGTLGHQSYEKLVKLLSLTDLSEAYKIILIHLSESNSDEEYMVNGISSLTAVDTEAAHVGDVWELSNQPF